MSSELDYMILPNIYPSMNTYRMLMNAIQKGDEETPKVTANMILTEIPLSAFTDLKSWPKTTKLLCWECGLSIDSMPVYIPWPTLNDVDGYYCSAPCAMNNLSKRDISENTKSEISRLFIIAMRLLYGRNDIIHIECAPNRTEMVQYGGGKYNHVTFKKCIREIETRNNCIKR